MLTSTLPSYHNHRDNIGRELAEYNSSSRRLVPGNTSSPSLPASLFHSYSKSSRLVDILQYRATWLSCHNVFEVSSSSSSSFQRSADREDFVEQTPPRRGYYRQLSLAWSAFSWKKKDEVAERLNLSEAKTMISEYKNKALIQFVLVPDEEVIQFGVDCHWLLLVVMSTKSQPQPAEFRVLCKELNVLFGRRGVRTFVGVDKLGKVVQLVIKKFSELFTFRHLGQFTPKGGDLERTEEMRGKYKRKTKLTVLHGQHTVS